MTAQIRMGTCSWTDSALTGNSSFYPSTEMTAEERLSFYAEHFPIVEVESTYYANFRSKLFDDMAEKNIYMRGFPPDLQTEAAQAFPDALLPLHSAGRLGVVFLYGIRSAKGLADLLGVF